MYVNMIYIHIHINIYKYTYIYIRYPLNNEGYLGVNKQNKKASKTKK